MFDLRPLKNRTAAPEIWFIVMSPVSNKKSFKDVAVVVNGATSAAAAACSASSAPTLSTCYSPFSPTSQSGPFSPSSGTTAAVALVPLQYPNRDGA